MTYTEIRVASQEKQDQYFRFGQPFTFANIEFVINRSIGNFLTEGLINQAIGRGFDIVDKDGQVVDWNETIQDIILPSWKFVKLAGKWERGFGKSLLHIFEDEDKKIIVRAFSPKRYTSNYKRNGSIKKLEIRSQTVDGDVFTHRTEDPENPIDLDFVHEIRLRPTDKIGESRSAIEKVWDQIYGLSTLDEHATYFAIKVGGGLFYYKIPASKLADPATRNKIKKQKENIQGMATIIIPIFDEYQNDPDMQPKIEQLSGDQIDFLAIRDLLLGTVSANTGIPREVLLGSELGLRSAETNQSAYFSILEEIQDDYVDTMKWLVRTIASTIESIPVDVEFDIQWKKRDTQTEEEKIKLLNEKSNVAKTLIDTGFTVESVLKLVDLKELEFDKKEETEHIEDTEVQPQLELDEMNQTGNLPQTPINGNARKIAVES